MQKQFRIEQIKQTKQDKCEQRFFTGNGEVWKIINKVEGVARITNDDVTLKFHWTGISETDLDSPSYNFEVHFAEFWDCFSADNNRTTPEIQRVYQEVANLCEWDKQVKSLINDLKYF